VSKRLHILLFLIGLSSCSVFAQDKEVVAIHGFDRMSCDDWAASKEDDGTRALYIAWIRGIITGYNYANPDNQVALGRMPGDFSLGLFVDSYCRRHRAHSFAGAAFDLISQKRGDSGLSIISSDAPDAAAGGSDDGYDAWLKRQSEDMRSLDPALLRNIYKKETTAKSGK
jgi:hypothetical protein